MPFYIVRTGMTRRLIEANTKTDAIVQFTLEVPRARLMAGDHDLTIHEATEGEIAEFNSTVRTFAVGDDQLRWELDPQ